MRRDPVDVVMFSVVTVAYNDVDGLRRTSDSVLAQDGAEFEWIVVDGGSSDGTAEFLSSLTDTRVRWVSEKDGGIYDAMNKGISLGEGDYIVFLNAGDLFENSGTLREVGAGILMSEFPDVVFGGANYIFENGRKWYRGPKKLEKIIWHGLPANHQATYYRREFLGDTRYDLSFRICGDYYLDARLFKRGVRASYLEQSLVRFFVGGTSYRNRAPLFMEPYRIQRDVLGMPLSRRLISLFRRVLATLVVIGIQKT